MHKIVTYHNCFPYFLVCFPWYLLYRVPYGILCALWAPFIPNLGTSCKAFSTVLQCNHSMFLHSVFFCAFVVWFVSNNLYINNLFKKFFLIETTAKTSSLINKVSKLSQQTILKHLHRLYQKYYASTEAGERKWILITGRNSINL